MKKVTEWVNRNKLILIVNIVLLIPLFAGISSFELNFSGDGSILNYNMSESAQQILEDNGKQFTPLCLPIHTTGEWTIRMFMLTLICTPISITFGWNKIRYRKLFGIYTFIYTVFHLLFF